MKIFGYFIFALSGLCGGIALGKHEYPEAQSFYLLGIYSFLAIKLFEDL